jgi:hypothetical protein
VSRDAREEDGLSVKEGEGRVRKKKGKERRAGNRTAADVRQERGRRQGRGGRVEADDPSVSSH